MKNWLSIGTAWRSTGTTPKKSYPSVRLRDAIAADLVVDRRSRNSQDPRNMSDVVSRGFQEEAEIILLELPEGRELGVLLHRFKVIFKVTFHGIASLPSSGPDACCLSFCLMKDFMRLG